MNRKQRQNRIWDCENNEFAINWDGGRIAVINNVAYEEDIIVETGERLYLAHRLGEGRFKRLWQVKSQDKQRWHRSPVNQARQRAKMRRIKGER